MTEAEWLTCGDADEMLRHLDADAGGRQPYLFSAACLRRIWHLLPGPNSQNVVLLLERWADGERGLEIHDAREAAREEATTAHTSGKRHPSVWAGLAASEWSPHYIAESVAEATALADERTVEFGSDPEVQLQCDFLRDIFGNPFRPVSFNPAWRTDTTVAVARQMYDSRDFGAMPILADALQDAGCDNDTILNHCRDANQPHVRGCWVVDLVLGKE